MFNIKKEFKDYLIRGKLDIPQNSIQYVETEKAYYAGIASLIIYQRDNLTNKPVEQGVKELEIIIEDCMKFWKNELTRFNSEGNNV